MIRGAFILAVGFGLGYAKALQEHEQASEFFAKANDTLDRFLDVKSETTPGTAEAAADETPETPSV